MIGYDEGRPSRELAEALIRSEGVVVIPGSAFGPWGERQLRVSFGFTGEGAIREAGERLARFFSGGRNR
jgi:aminotransferase